MSPQTTKAEPFCIHCAWWQGAPGAAASEVPARCARTLRPTYGDDSCDAFHDAQRKAAA